MTDNSSSKSPRIAFIRARWHSEIVDQALKGFTERAANVLPGTEIDIFDVPGALEAPLVAKKLAKTGKYEGIVVAALVVDGGIYRHDFVAGAVVDGLVQVGLETEVPVYSVSLTPHNFQPVEVLEGFYHAHFVKKGAEAAEAVKAMRDLEAKING